MVTGEELLTRRSLLLRLKDLSDEKSWREFFELYWKLIYGAGLKAGLSEAEAQDVVQETLLTVTKKIQGFEYDPAKGKFKGWLLHITRWRIGDQFRKRLPVSAAPLSDTGATTAIGRIPDPASLDLDEYWEREWRNALLAAALERVKAKISAQEMAIFDVYVLKGWPAERVATHLDVEAQLVYNTKQKVTVLMKKAVKNLEAKWA